MVYLEELKRYPIAHGVSDRRTKLEDFLKTLGAAEPRLAKLEQVHKGKVANVTAKTDLSSKIAGCDGAITNAKGVALMVMTADCLPIFLYDPEKHAIGIAHAGWRGTAEGIAKNVVNAMKAEFGSEPAKILIGFGPAIRQCCYEVSREFLVHFPGSVVKMAHKYYFDLAGENAEQLLSLGVNTKNMFDCGICTSCRSDEFYCYRKEADKTARMASVIMLK
jgi:YfiH family protein